VSELLSSPDAEVVVEKMGALVVLRLNRPKAINSLTLGMLRQLDEALARFEHDDGVAAILLEGAGERGLCAGGDIRAIYDSGRAGDDEAPMFWREEYRLDARIAHYPKPYIAVMDGITMGGGVGVSAHARHRIVTERTKFAMPEVGIGLVPDVGGSWLLPRAPDQIGTYFGLTGETFGAGDVILCGLADFYVPTGKLAALKAQLSGLAISSSTAREVETVMRASAEAPPPARLEPHRKEIAALFAHSKVEDILAALDAEGSEFAQAAARTIRTRSPTSLKLALRLMTLGRKSASLEECLVREYWVVTGILQGKDFYEGVRAAVIDKDRNPRWSPATLEEVADKDIEALLRPNKNPALAF